MKYQQPFNESNPDAPYVDGNPVAGIEGSIPRAAAIEHPQREIVALIRAAGLPPYADDLSQLLQGVRLLIQAGIDANRPTDIPARALIHFGAATGSGGSFNVASLAPGLPYLDVGTLIEVAFPGANGGAATVTFGGLASDANPVRILCRSDGSDLRAGDIVAGHTVLAVRADGKLQILGNAPSTLFQSFYQQLFATPLSYWRLDSPLTTVPAGSITALGNYGRRVSTMQDGTDVSQSSGVVTIGPNDGGVYILTATNAMDNPTTEESIYIFKGDGGNPVGSAISISRGVYPAPGSNAMDKSTPAIIRLAPGDKVYAAYLQNNPDNAAMTSLNQPLGHFGGVRVGG